MKVRFGVVVCWDLTSINSAGQLSPYLSHDVHPACMGWKPHQHSPQQVLPQSTLQIGAGQGAETDPLFRLFDFGGGDCFIGLSPLERKMSKINEVVVGT